MNINNKVPIHEVDVMFNWVSNNLIYEWHKKKSLHWLDNYNIYIYVSKDAS